MAKKHIIETLEFILMGIAMLTLVWYAIFGVLWVALIISVVMIVSAFGLNKIIEILGLCQDED